MRIHSRSLRRTLALALAGAVAATAPAAASQELTPVVGSPIPYRVSLPAGAEIEDDGEILFAETGNALVLVGAIDLVKALAEEEPLLIPESEARKRITDKFMTSDSMLLLVLSETWREPDVELENRVAEIRTLGGQRASYVRGVYDEEGEQGWIEMYLTIKDGVIYTLLVATMDRDAEALESLASRIHASFVLPDALP